MELRQTHPGIMVTVVMPGVVATEFGRTAKVNGTRGTDHGTASAALVLGGGLKPVEALVLVKRYVDDRPLAESIPTAYAALMAALVGVMFMVVIGTFAWNSLTILRRVPLMDAFVILLVTVVTVMEDLAVAVVASTGMPAGSSASSVRIRR